MALALVRCCECGIVIPRSDAKPGPRCRDCHARAVARMMETCRGYL